MEVTTANGKKVRLQKTIREDVGPTGRVRHETWWRILDAEGVEHGRMPTRHEAKATAEWIEV